MKKKRFSVLKCFISIVCVLFIIICVGINVIFSQTKTPSFMGRYFYIVTERDTNGIDNISKGCAIIAKDTSDVSISQKDLVLSYTPDDPNNLRLCGVFSIVTTDDGTEKYQLYYDGHEDNSGLVTKDRIKAICTGCPQSEELGTFITFTRGIPGIVAELIIPCIILLVFFISKISSKEEDIEEEIPDFSSDSKKSGSKKTTAQQSGTPLFEPSHESSASDELEKKKMSIAENFSQKKVNPDSPYQKEKERTMQFKSARTETSTIKRTSPAPSADDIREDLRRKNEYEGAHVRKLEKLEKIEKPEVPSHEKVNNDIIDNTGIISTAQVSEMSGSQEGSRRTSVEEIKNNINKKYTPVRKSTSPDISDIISKSEANKRKRNVSDMSVDDLLRIIEEEKRKL